MPAKPSMMLTINKFWIKGLMDTCLLRVGRFARAGEFWTPGCHVSNALLTF